MDGVGCARTRSQGFRTFRHRRPPGDVSTNHAHCFYEAARYTEGCGYGLVLFMSILLVVAGCFNVIQGIAAIANSHVFTWANASTTCSPT